MVSPLVALPSHPPAPKVADDWQVTREASTPAPAVQSAKATVGVTRAPTPVIAVPRKRHCLAVKRLPIGTFPFVCHAHRCGSIRLASSKRTAHSLSSSRPEFRTACHLPTASIEYVQ